MRDRYGDPVEPGETQQPEPEPDRDRTDPAYRDWVKQWLVHHRRMLKEAAAKE